MKLERGDFKSERLGKRKTVTSHRPAKRPRLLKANQQETELKQRRTFPKWRHNLAVYYAENLRGSCVNNAKHTCQPLAVPDKDKVEIHPIDQGGSIVINPRRACAGGLR